MIDTTSVTPTAREQYDVLTREIDALLRQRHAVFSQLFQDETRALFFAHPVMTSFSWSQYTPYFNDGDPCLFGVNCSKDEIWINEVQGYEREEEDEALDDAYASVEAFLESLNEDDLLQMFDDHVQVTIYPDGLTNIEQYSHD